MIYLASPYSHLDPLIMKTRFLLAEQTAAILTAKRIHVYSPIVHYHEMAAKFSLQTDFEFWKQINFDMIRRADTIYVLTIEGWKESKGVTGEVAFARTFQLPLYAVTPDGDVFEWPAS